MNFKLFVLNRLDDHINYQMSYLVQTVHTARRIRSIVEANKTTASLGAACAVAGVIAYRRISSPAPKNTTTHVSKDLKKKKKKLNKVLLKEIWQILKIVIPNMHCQQFWLLVAHTATLICRSLLSVYVAHLEGDLVRTIVQKQPMQFISLITKWLLTALPATFVNSLIKYLESYLAMSMRNRLVHHLYSLYFDNDVYYKMGNLDSRISNPVETLTEESGECCNHISQVYSHMSKPILDLALISYTLIKRASEHQTNAGFSTAIGIGMIAATGKVLRMVSPNFSALVAEKAKRQGHWRYVHSRLIENAEEIAFYGGHKVEKSKLIDVFKHHLDQLKTLYAVRLWYIWMEQFLLKYCWSAGGLIMVAAPMLFYDAVRPDGTRVDNDPDGGVGERTRAFTTARNLLTSAADAVERLFSSYKMVAELAGYVERVLELKHVMEDVSHGHYLRDVVHHADGDDQVFKRDHQVPKGIIVSGCDYIKLDKCPVVTPNGDLIVESLDLDLKQGMHLLITGPNGCGKSSLFRMLSDLWPVYGGHINKPLRESLFYIPQRPYMTIGTFLEQIIYPDTKEDMLRKGFTDKDIWDILDLVYLRQIVEREKGWDRVGDWKDVLSGGEKQRVGLARVFYHKPKYALLDECTSAISIDVEGKIYDAMKAAGVTLLTVTHRPSLWRYHTHILHFLGDRQWKFSELTQDDIAQVAAQLTSGSPERLETENCQ